MTPERRFAFRLAKELGYANPDYMLASMPYHTFLGWMKYANVEPFGEERADLRAAIVASTIANCMARKKGQRAYRPAQFMPKFGEEPRSRFRTPEEQLETIKVYNRLLGGNVVYADGPIGSRK